MNTTSQRTQIILPKSLREEIERQRLLTGESMAQFLRKSAEERLAKEKKKKTDLKKLADSVIGSIKPGNGGWGDVKDSYSYIRKMRQADDEHRQKRLDQAFRKSANK